MVREELASVFLAATYGNEVTPAEIRAHTTWLNTGIPRRFWGYSLREHTDRYPETTPLKTWVVDYCDRHALDENGYPRDRAGYGAGIFLYGPPGRGKTTAACATLTSFAKLYSKPVFFVRWDNFLRIKQALIGDRTAPADYTGAVAAVENSELVALDDVGHEYSASAYGPSLLDQTIRSRYDRGLPTIITTNLSENEWTQRYDATLTSFVKRACRPMQFSPNAG